MGPIAVRYLGCKTCGKVPIIYEDEGVLKISCGCRVNIISNAQHYLDLKLEQYFKLALDK